MRILMYFNVASACTMGLLAAYWASKPNWPLFLVAVATTALFGFNARRCAQRAAEEAQIRAKYAQKES